MKTILFLLVILSMNSSAYDDGYAYNEDTKIFYVDYGPADASPILLVQGLGGQLTFCDSEK
jgi:hypothetical protein